MKLTYLDLGIYKDYGNSIDKVYQLFDISQTLENLGYNRLWLGEHHSFDCAWRSPEILISILLGATEKIKIGSAGNLIKLHNTLRLAQDYSILEGIFKGRVDMGIAAGSTTPKIKNALLTSHSGITNNNPNDYFLEKISDLFNFFDGSFDENNSFYGIHSPPYIKNLKPNIWFLSTSNSKTDLAINYKTNYVWSLFHKKEKNWPSFDSISRFETDYYNVNKVFPETAISISGICINDKKRVLEIQELFKNNFHMTVGGTIDECRNQIKKILKKYSGVQELVIADFSLNIDEKIESSTNFKSIIDDLNL